MPRSGWPAPAARPNCTAALLYSVGPVCLLAPLFVRLFVRFLAELVDEALIDLFENWDVNLYRITSWK